MALSEDQIIARESGGNPYVGYTSPATYKKLGRAIDLSKAPLDEYGFPIWEGDMGPSGLSHAAGIYQFEPKEWARYAGPLGIKDFSPQSQKMVYDAARAAEGDRPWLPPEGQYGGALHVNVRPQPETAPPPAIAGFLASLVGEPGAAAQPAAAAPSFLDRILAEATKPEEQPAAKPPEPKLPEIPPPVPPLPPETTSAPPLLAPPLQNAPAGASEARTMPQGPSAAPVARKPAPALPAAPSASAPPPAVKSFLDSIISGFGQTEEGRVLGLMGQGAGAAAKFLTRPDQVVKRPFDAQAQNDDTGKVLLDQIVSQLQGPQPTPDDIAQAKAANPTASDEEATEIARQQMQPEPLVGVGAGGELTGRIPRMAEIVGGGMAGPVPGGALGAGPSILGRGARAASEAERIEPTFGKEVVPPDRATTTTETTPQPSGAGAGEPPRGPMPPATPMPPPAGIGETARALDDDLFTRAQRNQERTLVAQKVVDKLPEAMRDPGFQAKAYRAREQRMIDPQAESSPDVARMERILERFDNEIEDNAGWIREHLADADAILPELRTAAEGHVHRKVIGQDIPGEMLDPYRDRDLITGASLSKRASGLMHRRPHYVLEDSEGNRIFNRRLLGDRDAPARYGESVVDPGTGKRWVAREPTTEEIENHTSTRYIKNLTLNTLDNWLRLWRVRDNLEILEKWKPKLYDAELWIPEVNQRGTSIPRGYQQIFVPQLRGWAEPRIAAVINDLFKGPQPHWIEALEKANHILIGSMFALPFRHQMNVGAHYMIGRGWDWFRSEPQFGRAVRAVATQNEDYLRLLRNGAGLRYASTLTENFYDSMLSKMFHDQVRDPQWDSFVKRFGVGVKDLVAAEYRWSRRNLWKVNDYFLTARIMELEGKGMPLKQAIAMAEREIPNYRIGPTLAGSKALASLLKSPAVAFGRYTANRWQALYHMVNDLLGPGKMISKRRVDALGQAVIMGMLGMAIYPAARYALGKAQDYLRDKPYIGGIIPDRPMELVGAGPMGMVQGVADMLTDGEKDWAQIESNFLNLSPVVTQGVRAGAGMKDQFTGLPIWDSRSTALGKTAQFGEWATGLLFPGQIALDMARKGSVPALGPSFGVRTQPAKPSGRTERLLRGAARGREKRDPVENLLRSLTR